MLQVNDFIEMLLIDKAMLFEQSAGMVMLMMVSSSMWHDKPTSFLARLVDSIKKNHICIRGGEMIKQRRWWSKYLIGVGNLFLRISNGHVFLVTGDAAWQRWELHSYQLLYQLEGQAIGNRAIRIPTFRGRSLREHIVANTLTPKMVIAAAREFRGVHGVFSPLLGRRWTHGDAHTGNVLYDDSTGRAYLIDFETQHQPECAENTCQADDLLVFILELMGTSSDWVQHSELFLRTYADQTVLYELEQRLQLQSELEQLLWKIRTNFLPFSNLQDRVYQLRRILARINQSHTTAVLQ